MTEQVEGQSARKRSNRRSAQQPTIADVAREAGVSPMTVSRVINREANVVEATRNKVADAIMRIGYVPNQAARTLAGARQCRIALLHDNPSAAWLSELLVGCLSEASEQDAQLVIERAARPGDLTETVRTLMAHRIEGVILPSPLSDDQGFVRSLMEAGIRLVLVATAKPPASVDSVSIDDHAAALELTRRLIGLGHRRIGFITGNPLHSQSRLRQAGYEAALAEAGLAPDPALIVGGDFSYRSGLDAAQHLITLASPPSAIFASNDDMAAAVVAAAHRRGIVVPQQLSVCGFDDTAMATTIWPELTTVRQPVGDMARTATAMLIEAIRDSRLEGASPPRHVILPHALVARDSDHAPGQAE